AFRRAAGQFASGIVVATTSLDGVSHAMTATAFTAVSMEPLLILMCAEKIARFHDAVLAAGTWAISVLGEDGEKTAAWLATQRRGGPARAAVGVLGKPAALGEALARRTA